VNATELGRYRPGRGTFEGESVCDREAIERLAREHGFGDFKWISGNAVQVHQWVRFKCMFGCASYGQKATCPPAVPSVAECRELFNEYDHVLVIHVAAQLDDPNTRGEWSRERNAELLRLERAAFLAGHHKALLLFMDECQVCAECARTRSECRDPKSARPCPEALGVDVFATVRSLGFPIEVLTDYHQSMNRYAFLLVA
jgi:predicted metal-binding protein